MAHEFDPGYNRSPFKSLVRKYPGADVYPADDFRVEWGPVFHRGRLDGSARVVVIGQDPATHEAIARRILVGEAGQRVQGFLAKLGIVSSYVMINAFLYSVYGQGGGARHKDDPAIAAYRNKWLDALVDEGHTEAVVCFGQLAGEAFEMWLDTPRGKSFDIPHRAVIHPTYPQSASAAGQTTKAAATKKLLDDWNSALKSLRPKVAHPDVDIPSRLYGDDFVDEDLVAIPERDLPAGLPEWMRSLKSWATRVGDDASDKRATIEVRVPTAFRTWDA